MTVPYTFATQAAGNVPASYLDSNFAAVLPLTGGTTSTTFPNSGTFAGSAGSALFWLNQSGAAASATVPEIGAQFTMTSATGYANRTTAYKIGLTSSVYASAGSADAYGFNAIAQGPAGAGGILLTGIESNINNNGADSTTLGSNVGSYGFVAAPGGTFKSTAAFWATGVSGGWQYGFAANTAYIYGSAFYDASSAASSLVGLNGLIVGSITQSRQSLIHGYASANSLQIIGRLENDNGSSPTAALGFSVSASGGGETRVAKIGIGATRTAPQGQGYGSLYNLASGSTADFATTDEVLRWSSLGTTLAPQTAIPAGGTAASGYMFSSTANYGIFFGSGAPTLSAAQGSLYIRSDGSTTTSRAYINTNGSTTWTAITTVA